METLPVVRQLGEGFYALVLMTAVLAGELVMVHKLKAGTTVEDDTTHLGKVRVALLQAFQIMETKNVFLPSDVLVLLVTAAMDAGVDLMDLHVDDEPEWSDPEWGIRRAK